ncbi:MAG TPA: NAD(P)-dependent oxidoreductase [Spirochaetia bacterium]|nr:NAD(P)-dependent oxidoreductase [Spirochaetia bacterium]
MKIVVFGITGRIGIRVAKEALDRGHEVTGVARDPSSATLRHPKLRTARGDVTEASTVALVAAGHDAVVCAVGPTPKDGGVDVILKAPRALMDGLKKVGAKRFLVVGGAGSLEVAPGKVLMDSPDFPAAWKPVAKAAADALALYRKERDLEWTYLSPAALIEPGTRTGSYRTGGEKLLTDAKGTSAISMEDFAIAVVDELEKPRHVRQRFTVAY